MNAPLIRKEFPISSYNDKRDLKDTRSIEENIDGDTLISLHANGSEDLGGGPAPEALISIKSTNPFLGYNFYKSQYPDEEKPVLEKDSGLPFFGYE